MLCCDMSLNIIQLFLKTDQAGVLGEWPEKDHSETKIICSMTHFVTSLRISSQDPWRYLIHCVSLFPCQEECNLKNSIWTYCFSIPSIQKRP